MNEALNVYYKLSLGVSRRVLSYVWEHSPIKEEVTHGEEGLEGLNDLEPTAGQDAEDSIWQRTE